MKRILVYLLLSSALFLGHATAQVPRVTSTQTISDKLVLPTKADPGTPTAQELWLSTTTANAIKYRSGGTTYILPTLSSKLSVFSATSSSELAGVISDETGSGALAFAISPTFVTPVLGAATATSLALTNGATITDPGTGAIAITASGTDQGITLMGAGNKSVAVGVAPSAYDMFRVQKAYTALPDNSADGNFVVNLVTGPSASDSLQFRSQLNYATINGASFGAVEVIGGYDIISNGITNAAKAVTSLKGRVITVRSSNAGTTGTAVGVEAVAYITGAGSWTTWKGFNTLSPSLTAAGTLGTAIGHYIEKQKVTGVTTGYGIYQADAADLNYFGGGTTFVGQVIASADSFYAQTADKGFVLPGNGYMNGNAGSVNIVAAGTNKSITLTPSGTGTVIIAGVSSHSGDIYRDGAAATVRGIFLATAGLKRWDIYASSEAESGSNAGSNFNIGRYADDGSGIVNAFQINRATGLVSVTNAFTVLGAITAVSVTNHPDGSTAAPSITFTADPDTGIARAGTNIMELVAGGTRIANVRGTYLEVVPTTGSTSTSTGALTVGGGLGVAGAGYFGGTVYGNNTVGQVGFSQNVTATPTVGQRIAGFHGGSAADISKAGFELYANENWSAGSATGTYALVGTTPIGSTTRTEVARFTNAYWHVPYNVTGGIQLFNTSDRTTNYERLDIYFSSNVARITSTAGGSGTTRSIAMGVGSGRQVSVNIGSSATILDLEIGSYAIANGKGMSSTGTLTQTSGTNAFWSVTPTYNQASGTAANTDLDINRTETAKGSGEQLLANFRVEGTSKFKVSNTGATTLASTLTTAAGITWDLGAANAVSPTAPDRTITVSIAGTTLYLHAKTTND